MDSRHQRTIVQDDVSIIITGLWIFFFIKVAFYIVIKAYSKKFIGTNNRSPDKLFQKHVATGNADNCTEPFFDIPS